MPVILLADPGSDPIGRHPSTHRRRRGGWPVVALALALLVAGLAGAQQRADGVRRVVDPATGRLAFVGVGATGEVLPGVAADVAGDVTPAGGLQAIAAYASDFGIADPSRELVFGGERRGVKGLTRALRYQQVYAGIPVVGGEMVVSYDRKGLLAAITGEVSPDLADGSLPTTPVLTPEDAAWNAITHVVRATGEDPASLATTPPELWIHDSRLLGPSLRPVELVWRLEVRSTTGAPIRFLVLVNAVRGGVSVAFNQVDTSWTAPTAGRARPASRQLSLFGGGVASKTLGTRNFATPDVETYDSHDSDARQGGTSSSGGVASTLVCSIPPAADPPALTGTDSCDGGSIATAANAAHYFAFDTFAYYDVNHGRDSIDGAGMALISNVDFTPYVPFPNPNSYANAFWDGAQMTYGNAGFWAADDVVGHELTHGVTEHASGLFYYYESGAINEALSDIFGEFVDQANGIDSFGSPDDPSDRWLIAEDSVSGGIRDMADPTSFSDPDRMRSPYYYAPGGVTYGYSGDNGGVHINSGVANKAASLLTDGGTFGSYTVAALGRSKVSAIFYEVNTTLLTSGSDYGVLGAALVQACQNLVGGGEGITAADCLEVGKAAAATEMGLDPGPAGYSPEAAYDCPNPADTPVDLFFDDVPASPAFTTSSGAPWYLITDYVASAPYSLWGPDNPSVDSWLRTASGITLSGFSSYFLLFRHAFGFEDYLLYGNTTAWDGGVVEYSTSGDAGPWADVTSGGPSLVDGRGYNGTVYTGSSSVLHGRPAFVYDSHGWVSTRYDLTALSGSTVEVRWRIGTDIADGDLGWFVDDVRVYGCGAVVACPYPTTVDLSGQTVTTTETFGACDTLTAGSSFAIDSPGDVTFVAGNRIVLKNGLSVGSGAVFEAALDPSLSP